MNRDTMEQLFDKSRERLGALESGTLHFLQSLQAEQNLDYDSFVAWRQNMLFDIQKIDSEIQRRFSENVDKPTPETGRMVEEFRSRQEDCIRKILNTDASIISIAGERLALVRNEMTNLSRGRRALRGYGSAVHTSKASLNSRA